jgi:ATP-dependent Clp protease ATP-binding subunit ClpC
MFERFSDRARHSVVAAQEHARLLGHDHIGSEHLLLGVLDVIEGNQSPDRADAVADVLAAAGVTVAAVSAEVGELADPGDTPQAGHIPFTAEAKKVLELSLREAIADGAVNIGATHILLAVIREGDGTGAQILGRLSGPLSGSALRQQIRAATRDETDEVLVGGVPRRVALHRREGPELPWVPRVRAALVSVDERLAAIEQHLGITVVPTPGDRLRLPELMDSVAERLGDLERHFGITPGAEPPDQGTAGPAGK